MKFSQFLLFFGFFFFFPISQSSFSIIILQGLWVGKWIICEFKWIFIRTQMTLGLWLYFQAVRSKHWDAVNLHLSDTHSHLLLTYFFKIPFVHGIFPPQSASNMEAMEIAPQNIASKKCKVVAKKTSTLCYIWLW